LCFLCALPRYVQGDRGNTSVAKSRLVSAIMQRSMTTSKPASWPIFVLGFPFVKLASLQHY
jgi:hypothetical protein